MRILKLESAELLAHTAADILCEAVAAKPDLSLALPTGHTTIPWYRELARRSGEHSMDLSQAKAFNLDELLLPPGHASSFAAFMKRHSWEKIGLDRSRCDIPRSDSEPALECRRYDLALAAAGNLDVVFVGVGEDGHVAYNLPGQIGDSTHLVTLPHSLADSLPMPCDHRPLKAITMGLGPMLSARRLVLMASSATKAKAVRALMDGPEEAAWPCSLLRSHPSFDVLLTVSAAGEAP